VKIFETKVRPVPATTFSKKTEIDVCLIPSAVAGQVADAEGPNYAELLEAARSGEAGAFEMLCAPTKARIYQTLFRITKNHEDAEDALQESFLSAYMNLHRFDGRSSFSTWLTRIGINAALMTLRKKRTHRELPIDGPGETGERAAYFEAPDHAPNPEERFARQEREVLVREAVQSLRPTIRKALELGQMQERSMRETAQMLGISVAAAKARLFHARAALRKSRQLKSMRKKWFPGRTGRFDAMGKMNRAVVAS
jgi:RNA polymerase sigma-70 factor, ECF subfamily